MDPEQNKFSCLRWPTEACTSNLNCAAVPEVVSVVQ